MPKTPAAEFTNTEKKSRKTSYLEQFSKLVEFDNSIVKKSPQLNRPILIGTDEVGRGCLAGPVVAAAVIMPSIDDNLAAALCRLNDSKKVSPAIRQELSDLLKQISTYAIAEASVEEIDQLNILQASFLAMRRAIEKLELNKDSILLVDGNQRIPQCSLKQILVIKGDSLSASIAAASILAKVYRDQLMCQLAVESPEYLWDSNKGYGSLEHRNAIAKKGLSPWHRKSFCSGLAEVQGQQLTFLR